MKKVSLLFAGLFAIMVGKAQLLNWAPQFPNDNSSITFTMNATFGNQAMSGFAGPVYMHFGVITNLSTSSSDWRYVTTTWATTTAPQPSFAGPNNWQFTINNPRTYFSVPAGETILRIAMVFRNAAGTVVQRNADGSDIYIPIFPAGTNGIQITNPFILPIYNLTNQTLTPTVGQNVPLAAVASTSAGTLNMYVNGSLISGPVSGTTNINGNTTAVYGNNQVVADLNLSGTHYYDTVQFYIPLPNTIAALPAGAVEGINYNPNCTSVTLVLYAPNKGNAVVIGEFPGSNWLSQPAFQMNKTPDGNYYWITLNGLTPGTEYAYQYLVDNTIYIADPYTEKVLDPWNDQYIPAATYPSLKPYPFGPNVTSSQNGLVGVLQTCQPAYNWKVPNFSKPDKRNLMTYEMLVRDFGDAAPNNYQLLIDTISYFKRLGVNAIELMPVNEFSGNQSWGYNTQFFFALDKAYGAKNKFKEFIDLCHENGIAVILDVVYNHMDAYNAPHGKLYWDAANGRPAANNPWLNTVAPHPYGVFEDFNHTSTATQYLVERSLDYWLNEYKVDGFRFDLAKGFTQTSSNGTTVENFDVTRVVNLERYYDYVIAEHPTTYMILEFLGQQRAEEQEYANHGFLLWGNSTGPGSQTTMGFSSNSNLSKLVYNSSEEAFSVPANMGYFESHDEERLMYRNEQFGNSNGGYNVRSIPTGLERQAAAAALLFTIPGPKMFWQFGERGYDITLGFGGSNVSNKPPHWEYMADPNRQALFNVYAKMISLRLANPGTFNNTTFSYDLYDGNGLVRRFAIEDPNGTGMKVFVMANFDVVSQARTLNFQTAGNWYNYQSNGTGSGMNGPTGTVFNLGSPSNFIVLQPGEYHVWIYHPPTSYNFIGNGNWTDASNWTYNNVPPSVLPSGAEVTISPIPGGECLMNTPVTISSGAKITVTTGKKMKVP